MGIKNIDLYYFSGTGNTYLVVNKMVEIFKKYGVEANLYQIEKSDPTKIDLNHIIGLGFPIAEQSTYDFVWKFIRSLPEADKTEIFMVDTLGGFSGGIVGPLREILKKKGYLPIGAKEIKMPLNIFYVQEESNNNEKIEKGLKEAEKYASDLILGKSNWGRIPLLSDLMYYISIAALKLTHSNLNQKYFPLTLNKNKCIKCGLCAKLCPIDNMQWWEGEYPVNLKNCEYCLRCTSFCPRNAISAPFNYKGKTYRAVKAKELI